MHHTIEITADQFPEVAELVIVADGSPWHGTFRQDVSHAANYQVYDEYNKSVPGAYRRIIAVSATLPGQ